MMTTDIEEYSDPYKNEVIGLILSIQQEEFNIPVNLEDQPDLINIPQYYQTSNSNFWVAKSNGNIVGTVALLDIGNSRGALRKMFVHADFRGKPFSVGKLLMDKLFDWVYQRGFSEILLGTTEKFIAAHRFYEKNGFKRIEKNQLPKEFPVMPVDVIFYKWMANQIN